MKNHKRAFTERGIVKLIALVLVVVFVLVGLNYCQDEANDQNASFDHKQDAFDEAQQNDYIS